VRYIYIYIYICGCVRAHTHFIYMYIHISNTQLPITNRLRSLITFPIPHSPDYSFCASLQPRCHDPASIGCRSHVKGDNNRTRALLQRKLLRRLHAYTAQRKASFPTPGLRRRSRTLPDIQTPSNERGNICLVWHDSARSITFDKYRDASSSA
jgi:hypothetical protein